MNASPVEKSQASTEKESRTFGFSYWPMVVEIALRLTVFVAWRLAVIQTGIFWLSEVLVSIAVLAFTFIREDKVKEQIRKEYDIPDSVRIDAGGTGLSFIAASLVILSGCYIAFFLFESWPTWLRVLLSVIAFVIYGIYMVFLYVSSIAFIPKPDESHDRSVEGESEAVKEEAIDRNDIDIATMETEITSASQRVDTFTLESALFGALAFSGFLALISSDKPILSSLHTFLAHLSTIIYSSAQLVLNDATLMSESNLIAAITLETLVCSMFFLAVIVSRLRFNDVLKLADYAVRTARTHNNKEEAVYVLWLEMLVEQQTRIDILQTRLTLLNQRTESAIEDARPLIRELLSILSYMRLFRDLGIASFVLILATSALLISSALSLLFVAIYLVSFGYMAIDDLARNKRLKEVKSVESLKRFLRRALR